MKQELRIGVISCEDLPKWGGEEGYSKLMIELFESKMGLGSAVHESHINWVPIHAVTGRLPDEAELKDYDGFFMSGSHYSVNDNIDWMLKLQEWIQNVKRYQDNNSNPPRIVALCFSHQIVNKALGGLVGLNPEKLFVWKAENIEINDDAKRHSFFSKSATNAFKIMETHGESVLEVPSQALTLASSATCQHEVVSIGDHILTMQCHPEMTKELMVDKIMPSLLEKRLISNEYAQQAIMSFETGLDDKLLIRMINNYFVKC